MEVGVKLLDLLVSSNIMKSKGEARRAISNNGIKINDSLVVNDNKILNLSDFNEDKMKISFGKKNILFLKLFRFL